jgi:hypothetical protein
MTVIEFIDHAFQIPLELAVIGMLIYRGRRNRAKRER